MSTEIQFEVESSRIDKTYGILITFSKSSLEEGVSEEEIPYYLLVFEGPEKHMELESVTEAFGIAHQDAMESVGLKGVITPKTFEPLLEESIELAGELMIKYGLKVLDIADISEDLITDLFDTASSPEETDPLLIN